MKRSSRKLTSLLLGCFLLQLFFQLNQPVISAQAEECPKYDLQRIFFEEFYPDVKWDNSSPPRTITWSTEVTSVEGNKVSRKFTQQESDWLDLSFGSWDEALDTINFRRISDANNADIQVGYVAIQNNGYWTVKEVGDFRGSGTIQLSTSSPFLNTKNGFIETAQSEIGNLLGLGDILGTVDVDSVMKDPDTAPFGSLPLSDYDIDLMRQFYGEITCHSAWSQALKDHKASALLEAEMNKKAEEAANVAAAAAAQAKADAEATAKAAAEAKAAETAQAALEAKLRAELAAQKKPTPSKTTITCTKGKLIKKVTAIRPVCPAGYQKK